MRNHPSELGKAYPRYKRACLKGDKKEIKEAEKVLHDIISDASEVGAWAARVKDERCNDIREFNTLGALTLRAVKFAASDVWGSADLHFNGDCFDKHEWSCRLRGGGLARMHNHIGTGETALAAIFDALEAKLKDMPPDTGKGYTYKKRFKQELQFLKGQWKKLLAEEATRASTYGKSGKSYEVI